ncbi:hypothetical protein AVO41_01585 [Thiomicrospira sp. WB1]|nr:hypothetical protein AVO41_01585 [Thiomicrospira sp. WB1]
MGTSPSIPCGTIGLLFVKKTPGLVKKTIAIVPGCHDKIQYQLETSVLNRWGCQDPIRKFRGDTG